MAMTLRLDQDVEDALSAAAARTGRPKARLVNDALRHVLDGAAGAEHEWRIPARGRWTPVEQDYLVPGVFTALDLVDHQREDRPLESM
ncbi:MAG: ribbon-helix-helix domain-containing protein [Bifidobacteriaceae bacterium]|jgi:hypothetical protein|nr:ribbon-helix-helix domain-containing protein [Bifidobacteriaceae bacterium]